MNYYTRHIGDYVTKCAHLSMQEDSAYNRIMDMYYSHERAPTKAEALRWARARTGKERTAVDNVLLEFFVERDGKFFQKRIEDELAAFHKRQLTNRELGRKGGQAKAKNGKRKKKPASDSLSDSLTESPSERVAPHSPFPIPQEKAKAKSLARASRLPDDWSPSRELWNWAMGETGRGVDHVQRQLDGFRDYWQSKATNATKLDWDATFRNWIRKASSNGQSRQSAADRVTTNIVRARALRAFAGRAD